MNITPLIHPVEIAQAFEAFLELRPTLSSCEAFVTQVCKQQEEGYKIEAIYEGKEVVACIGYRVMTTLAWGRILYIDDLITKERCRGKGYAKALLDHATRAAKKRGCGEVHLDTGYARHAAHRAYLRHGFQLNCHHMALSLDK